MKEKELGKLSRTDLPELLANQVREKAFGECNLKLPCQVPDSGYFVMGDYRSAAVDRRNTAAGSVPEEQIVGKIAFCI